MDETAELSDLIRSWHVFHTEDGLPEEWGIPTGTPFLLGPDFRYDRELNEFFYSADMLSARATTRDGYARDLLMFFNFLHRSRNVANWRHATEEDHRAYLVWRRFDPQGPGVIGATWNREVSAQARFFRWQAARGRITSTPVPQRARRHRPGFSGRGPGETAATYAHDAKRGNVKWLPAASYRLWRDVGLRGYLPDGLPDPAFRGRWASRNSTFADLMVRTGMRLTEQVSLLTGELPRTTDRGYERLRLSGAVAKAGSERWVYVPTSVLREIATYVAFDRGAIVDAARERGGYERLSGHVWDATTGRVTFAWPDGLRTHTRAELLTPEQRQNTVVETEDGLEPAALWLSEAGTPMAAHTWKDIFRQANVRCDAHDVRLRAHPHLLRHTFAVLTLEQLQRGHIDQLSGLSPQQRTHYARVFGDPLDWVRRALGHRSVTTTQVYLHALEELEMETRLALIPREWEDPRTADFSGDQS